MSVLPAQPAVPAAGPSPQELAWRHAEGEAAVAMGTVNAAIARLVVAVRELLATDGWLGHGIQSPEHWLCWKAGVARSRAEGLVRIARRAGELPACWALFVEGRLGEDAMARIARRVPAARDGEIAAIAPQLLIAQLDRLLRSLPEIPSGDGSPPPERELRLHDGRDGWLRGRFCLPADEGAMVRLGLTNARDAEFRDRNGLTCDTPGDVDATDDAHTGAVTWADALVRMASEAADALDPTLARTGSRGDRNKVVVHVDLGPDGTRGPGQIELGPVVPDAVTRFLSCDAQIQVMAYRVGQLVGIRPAERTVNRALRHYLARRDQGCAHPLCSQRLWLHAHHLVHWAEGGLTEPQNLLLICPRHHRALHSGEFSIVGDPEVGTVRFLDRWGQPITPPHLKPPGQDPPAGSTAAFTPPLAERLRSDSFTWN